MFAVEMQHINKSFDTLTATRDVNLQVREGEIHALIGENGAGKSTLMRILYGFYSPDSGKVLISGREAMMKSPLDAIKLGIGMVHQHFMLIPTFSVTENIVLGAEATTSLGILNRTSAAERVATLSETYKLNLDPTAQVGHLSIGFQQRVEILKILYRDARIIILDEPTPVLAPQEIEDLFAILTKLKNEGKTIILITHKLPEVMSISDRITVMRRGEVVAERETRSTDPQELARLMIGEDIGQQAEKDTSLRQDDILVVDHVSAQGDRGTHALKEISFTLKCGEILGIAGIEGNGQTELVQILAGLRMFSGGSIRMGNRRFQSQCSDFHLGHIPEDRLKHAVVLDFSLEENLILGRQRELEFASHIFLRAKNIRNYSNGLTKKFDVRPAQPEIPVRSLSGGNQQKAVVARELSKNAPLIIASQPTRGLDIRAIDFIHNALIMQRNEGKGILLVSSDLAEILKLSDRIAVMYEGTIRKIFDSTETDERQLGLYMTGSIKKSA